jgi:hypothetical protein
MIDTVFFIFRPLNSLEKGMKSLNIVDCPNNREVVVKERNVDRITRTFAFDRVFGPNSKQVSNDFRYSSNCNSKRFICLFKSPVILLVYSELQRQQYYSCVKYTYMCECSSEVLRACDLVKCFV